MTEKQEEELGKLSFPCTIGIKAMGRQADDFEHKVKDIVASHTEEGAIVDVRCRESNSGNFHSVTCEVRLENREQMEAIYQTMHDHPDILMTL
jgi:putative lipoic acid-binding regulatory protein